MLAPDGELPSDRFVVPPPPSPPGLRGRSAPACRRAPITGGRYRKSTLTENAPYKSHFPTLQFCLPSLLHSEDIISCCCRASDLKNRDLVITRVTALQALVAAVTGLHIPKPAAPESVLASSRPN